VRRLDNGSWLLTGTPVGRPMGAGVRLVPPRRKRMPRQPDAALTEPGRPPAPPRLRSAVPLPADRAALRARLERLREDSEEMSVQLRGAQETTTELCRRMTELRAQRAATLRRVAR